MLRAQSKYWCITINNPIQPLNNPPINFDLFRRKPKYVIYSLEEEATIHLQMYIVFDIQIRGSTLSKMFGCKPHIEKRLKTHSQARDYCRKPETHLDGPWYYGDEEGISEGQGARSDLKRAADMIDAGASIYDMAMEHPTAYIKHGTGILKYKRLKATKRNWVMEVITLIGGTGVGKTHWAYEHYPDLYAVPPTKQSGCYWDDYDGQETILIDEMYGNRFSHGFLLMLTDKYPFTVPNHGGSLTFNSRRIIFTSNADPDAWYTKPYENITFYDGPLYRRLVRGNSFIARVDQDHSINILYYK